MKCKEDGLEAAAFLKLKRGRVSKENPAFAIQEVT